MSRMKELQIGFMLVENYAEAMRQSIVAVNKGQINEAECIAHFTECVGKLTQVIEEISGMRQQEG